MMTISIADFLALCDRIIVQPYDDYPVFEMDCNGHAVSVSDLYFNTVVIDGKAVTLLGEYILNGKTVSPKWYVANMLR